MKKTEKQKYLTEDEYLAFLKAIPPDSTDFVFFYLTGNLGLRVGECIRLRVQDVDFKEKYLRCPTLKQDTEKKKIQGKMVRIKKGSISHGELPKTYKDLPLAKEILTLLQDYITKSEVTNWMFLWYNGTHIPRYIAQKRFKKYAKRAGLDSSYSIHSLRHYRGTKVYNVIGTTDAVTEALRHSDSNSAKRYAHMSMEKKRALFDKVGAVALPSVQKSEERAKKKA